MSFRLLLTLPLGFIAFFAAATSAGAQGAVAFASGGPALVHNLGERERAWQLGGGAEWLRGNAGVGGGLDYVYLAGFETSNGRETISSPAANALAPFVQGSFRFGRNGTQRTASDAPLVQPFVSAGMTVLTGGDDTVPMLHVAGGIDWWATRRTGLRVEVREQFGGMLSVRCGIVLR